MSNQQASLATVLKERRASLGLSLKEIEFDTKIRPQYIEALENREFDKLPVDLYMERIVKNYAYYLGLDGKVALKLLRLDKDRYNRSKRFPGSTEPVNAVGMNESDQFVSPLSTHPFVFTAKTFVISLTGLATVLVGVYLGRLIDEYKAAPELVISEPRAGVVIESTNVRVAGEADPGAVVYLNNLAVSVGENGEFQETLYLQDGVNKVLVRAVDNLSGKVTEKELVVQANVPDTGRVLAAGDDAVTVELNAEDGQQSWLRVVADGKQVYEGTLTEGMTFTGEEYVYLLAGNAGALAATYNGESLGTLGGPGEVVRKVYGDVPEELQDVNAEAVAG